MGDDVDHNPVIRVSDTERSVTADRLRQAQDEGRLSLAEYDERVQKAYAAVTRADLEALTADLPAARATPEVAEKDEATAGRFQEWRSWAGTSVLLIGIWGIICLAAGELIFFWPMFPIGIWGLVLLTSTFDGSRNRRSGRDRIEE